VRATKDIAAGWDGDARDRDEAADALIQLRDAEALARGKIAEQMIEIARLNANQRCAAIEQGDVGYPCVFRAEAEAEVARLTTKCKYGDPMCPCQDGDACHYEGDNPMTPPPIAALKARIAALEAERDCANDRAATHLADAYSMRDQRDALKQDAERTHERICQAIDCRNMGDHARGWGILRWWLVDVAGAAREKP
jgi:hypothetical protein